MYTTNTARQTLTKIWQDIEKMHAELWGIAEGLNLQERIAQEDAAMHGYLYDLQERIAQEDAAMHGYLYDLQERIAHIYGWIALNDKARQATKRQ